MKKYFLFLLLAATTLHSFSQAKKTIIVTTANLCDDIDKYKNKDVAFEVFYSNAQNQMWGLRVTNRDEEKLNSCVNFGICEQDDVYYTRKTVDDCKLVLRIPYTLSVPNLSSGFIIVGGKVDSKGNIIVRVIKRSE